jgi:hypothetical protein
LISCSECALLHFERADEDIHGHQDYVNAENNVVGSVGILMVSLFVEVECCSQNDAQYCCHHLQDDRDADQAQHQDVEFVLFADLQDVFELGGVGGEEGYVEEALRDGLLRRIFVRVQRFLKQTDVNVKRGSEVLPICQPLHH